ncbi:hypothetical protein [Streptomyces luteolus]|uniref:Uncharacterized protein n=1 Tax=Streptomyces luteolus TaxID=3043615 RepID=A0ABT6T5G8_9ACTN|nr:hypothetical protein [Streptomyces sp. B-S-A12]MDI3422142.1 hypothetical protein [Streptomyces sp. B-S-A12]
MAGKLRASPSDLHAAGSAQHSVAEEIKGPIDKAVADTKAAAGSLEGWAVGAELKEIEESWETGLSGLYHRMDTGSFNLHETAKTHKWNEELVAGDFEAFDGTGGGVIASAPASAGPGIQTMSAPAGPGTGPIPGGPTRPGLDDFMDAKPAMPTYTPEAEGHAAERDPRASWTTGEMLDAQPITPTYTPGAAGHAAERDPGANWTAEDMRNAQPITPTYTPGAAGHAAERDPGANWTAEDMRNARPVTPSVDPDEIRGGPARNEGPTPDRFNDFG